MIEEKGGIKKAAARHTLMRDMARTGARALGLKLLTKDTYASPTITTIEGPKDIDLGKFLLHLKTVHYLDIVGGSEPLQGEVSHLEHMDYCFPSSILEAMY